MDCSTLIDFRENGYATFTHTADAMFDFADALLTDTQAQRFIELALSPAFRRRWPSIYEALEDGIIDAAALASGVYRCGARSTSRHTPAAGHGCQFAGAV